MSGGSRIRSFRVTPIVDMRDEMVNGSMNPSRYCRVPTPRFRVELEVDADEMFVRKLQAFVEAENAPASPDAPTMRMLPERDDDDEDLG